MQDKIEKTLELEAPVARVWRAITDYREFGQWFRVAIDGPFAVGEVSRGRVTYPGCEHMQWYATVQAMEPERLFAFTWCPYSPSPGEETPTEPTTLVEFKLEPTAQGTRLVIIESGFDALPDNARRDEALRLNSQGWEEQSRNITAHLRSPDAEA